MTITKSQVNTCVSSALGVPITSIDFIEDGIEITARVSLEYHPDVVFKAHHSNVYSNPEGFRAGAVLMNQLSSSDIPLPEVYYISEPSGDILGTPYYIMEFIEGESIDWSQLDTADRTQIIHEMSAVLSELHSVSVPNSGTGWAGVTDDVVTPFNPSLSDFSVFLVENWKQIAGEFTEDGRFNDVHVSGCRFEDLSDGILEVSELVEENISLEHRPRKYCHWDFRFDNFLVKENTFEINGVIDWENPLVADPLYNLARVEFHTIDQFRPEFTLSDKEQLREEFITSYREKCDPGVFSTGWESLLTLYRFESLLTGLINFPLWFDDLSEDVCNEAEEYYREMYVDLKESIGKDLS